MCGERIRLSGILIFSSIFPCYSFFSGYSSLHVTNSLIQTFLQMSMSYVNTEIAYRYTERPEMWTKPDKHDREMMILRFKPR